MDNTIEELVGRIKRLESELRLEVQKKEREFYYHIQRKKVSFERETRKRHRRLVKKIHRYLRDASVLNILTAPVIWLCLVPAVLMDAVISMYQAICFPVYGIPKVRRDDYIVVDRHYLQYLNAIEKLNCAYCGYFNGLMGYVQEIAGRTEQYWCPIKHARPTRFIHNRYQYFFDYGDGETYRQKLGNLRTDFKDLENEEKSTPAPGEGEA